MLGIGPATRIYLAVAPADMRKSFEGLSGLVREKLRQDPLSGHLFLFCNKGRNRLKVMFWDGSGLWVCAKRLEKGRFTWPVDSEGVRPNETITLRQEELSMLLGGIDLSRAVHKRSWWRRDGQES